MLSYTYLMGVDSSTPTCLKRGNMSLIVDVTTAISNVFENNDIRLVEVNFEKRHDGNYLVVYIDKDSGVKLEDCEYVHNSIDPILDQLDPTQNQPYNLEVSSYGLDKPLKYKWQFERNRDKKVEVHLYSKQNGCKIFVGNLLFFDDDSIEIQTTDGVMKFSKSTIAVILPYIEF
ncbi:MAG: ribosome maturation factor RimP [Clostridia bacterium]|nr:ribosome maturation factor RimP [Clostridia bacterium]